jgi:hypothetical protein
MRLNGGLLSRGTSEYVKNMSKGKEVKDIILKLIMIDVDGETMQHILQQVGMEDQMLRQLMLTQPAEHVEALIEERNELEKKF